MADEEDNVPLPWVTQKSLKAAQEEKAMMDMIAADRAAEEAAMKAEREQDSGGEAGGNVEEKSKKDKKSKRDKKRKKDKKDKKSKKDKKDKKEKKDKKDRKVKSSSEVRVCVVRASRPHAHCLHAASQQKQVASEKVGQGHLTAKKRVCT